MNFINKNIIATVLVSAALLPVSSFLTNQNQIAYANTVEYRVVNGNSVNFRKGPSTSYESLAKLNKGDKVEYISTSNSWTKAKYNNQTGYIYSKYISEIETKIKYVNCSALNVRSGAGTNYSIIKTIPNGTEVEEIAVVGSWSKVKVGTTTGYVYNKYLSEKAVVSTVKKYVNCSSLNVRKGPGTDYSIIKSIPRDTQVEVISTNGGWSKIQVGSTVGYVSSKYLSDTKGSSSSNGSSNTSDSSAKVDKLISFAKAQLGKPYVWGAEGPNSFDCSGFTYYVFKNSANITLPRTSKEQSNYGTTVSKSNLKVGDLVFFDTSGENDGNVSHVGIYIGSNQFIHSSSSKEKVVISDFSNYYNNAFVRAKRVL